jgi:toxin YoeB
MYKLKFTNQAQKDSQLLKRAALKEKTQILLNEVAKNPTSFPAKKLSGNLLGMYSRRISIKHRLVYQIYEPIQTIKILRMWSHYENL